MYYLPMPFARRARFVLANDGDRDYSQSVAYGIDHETSENYAREKSRLHCAWRRSNPVQDGVHAILDVKGRGHYVGNILQVHTGFAGWWGEGDTAYWYQEDPHQAAPLPTFAERKAPSRAGPGKTK